MTLKTTEKPFKYYLLVISLNGCPYSKGATELLDNFHIKYQIVNVDWNDKDKYKTNQINTFPQIYLKRKSDNQSLLLGGYDDLKYFIDMFINQKYNDKNINLFQKKYSYWSKHAILRLIELFI
jgi:glutaredoxin